MSRLKTFVLSPTRVRSLRRAASICGLGLAMIATSSQVNAACSYVIDTQWDNGFAAKIKITNTNSAPISSWSIGWQYAGGNRVMAGSSYNVTLTGSNPYTATNISWNGNIPVGGSQEFGFQGTKAAGSSPEIPTITGAACGGTVASVAASSTPARSSTGVVASSSSSVISTGGPAAISVSGNKVLFGGQVGSISGASMFWSNTGWGGDKYYNAQAVSWLKSDWNAKLVRAAMGVNDDGGYLTDASNKTRAVTVVDAAIANNMYVIIDFHTHVAQDYKAQSIAFFQEMATKYGNRTNVIYEIYNEPLQISWSSVIKPYAIDVIKAIRAIDPDNLIIVGTPSWSQDVDVAALDPIVGYGNIAYTLHFYAGTHKQSLRDKAALALSRGIPLFVTEWGSTDASGDGAVNVTETNAWVAFMKANNISNANWSIVDKAEGSAALVTGSSATGGWQLTTSGALAKSITQGWPALVGGGSSTSSVAPSSIPASSKASSAVASSVRSSVAPSSSSITSSSSIGAGVLFQDTFEAGTVNTTPAGWSTLLGYNLNGSNVSTGSNYALVDSSKAYTGTKSIHFKGGMTQILKALPAGVTRLHMRAYVNMGKQMGSQPGDNHEHIMGVKATQDANNEIRVGQIKGALGTNEVPSDNIAPAMASWGKGPIISANQWHCVETAMYTDTAYDELRMWVNGVLVHSITSGSDWNNGSLSANWMDGKFKFAEFGFHSFSGNTTDVWMDDIVVSTQPIGCGPVVVTSSSARSSVVSSVASSVRSSVAPSSVASSIALSSVRSSVAPSSTPVTSSRASTSSVGTGLGNWQLSATDSYLNFVTTKNTHTIEVHKFDSLSGSLTDAGVATLTIDLASVNTANTLRDQRLRDLFFETGLFPSAIATFNVDTSVLSSIAVGQSAVVDLAGTLDLHGVTALMSTKVMVQKLSSTRVMVQSVAPVIVRSADHNLVGGVEALRAAVGIASVSGIAPVDFVLVFNAQ